MTDRKLDLTDDGNGSLEEGLGDAGERARDVVLHRNDGVGCPAVAEGSHRVRGARASEPGDGAPEEALGCTLAVGAASAGEGDGQGPRRRLGLGNHV